MPTVLDPFQFVLIAVAGWMNQRQLQMIEYLREENRVLRAQLGATPVGRQGEGTGTEGSDGVGNDRDAGVISKLSGSCE
jgi:hypothetical protein